MTPEAQVIRTEYWRNSEGRTAVVDVRANEVVDVDYELLAGMLIVLGFEKSEGMS